MGLEARSTLPSLWIPPIALGIIVAGWIRSVNATGRKSGTIEEMLIPSRLAET